MRVDDSFPLSAAKCKSLMVIAEMAYVIDITELFY